MIYSKYNNKKTMVKGINFDSQKEAYHYLALLSDKTIKYLELQPRFLLQEKFTDNLGNKHRAIEYVADFTYMDDRGRKIVVDVKGMKTETYKLKRKWFIHEYPNIIFEEV